MLKEEMEYIKAIVSKSDPLIERVRAYGQVEGSDKDW